MHTYYFKGTCVSSFDDYGECTRGLTLPYKDVTSLAQALEKNTHKVSRKQFINNVILTKELKKLLNSYTGKRVIEFWFDNKHDIYIMYDNLRDIHYFFQ